MKVHLTHLMHLKMKAPLENTETPHENTEAPHDNSEAPHDNTEAPLVRMEPLD